MIMDLAPGWKTESERGPDWLFVTLFGPDGDNANAAGMAQRLWQMMQAELKGRLLLELDQLQELPEDLIDELAQLRDDLERRGGVLRLCGLADEHQATLREHDRAYRFAHFRDREQAVRGFYRPGKPR